MLKFKENKAKGFTLVELLAVIVILAIILVIAVPKVMSVIEDAKKATLESTAKMIASQAEKQKVQNTVLGNDKEITCKDITNINDADYASCEITFDNNTAKVTIKGGGKFAGLNVCNGTKTDAEATGESCTPVVNATNFADDDWATIVAAVQQAQVNGTEYPYQVGEIKTVDMGSLGTHTIRVANTTNCSAEWMEDVTKSKTACGFVLEFADIITTYNMNPAGEYYGTQYDYGTSLGGWPASAMRKHLNDLDSTTDEDGVIYNALPEELRKGIINTYVVSSYGPDKTTGVVENENAGVLESELYWSNDKIYLLLPQEVYGVSFTNEYDKSNGTSRQLDYYEDYQGDGYRGVSTTKCEGAIKQNGESNSKWWLRSVRSDRDNLFYFVGDDGYWRSGSAYNNFGLAPAFRLAN